MNNFYAYLCCISFLFSTLFLFRVYADENPYFPFVDGGNLTDVLDNDGLEVLYDVNNKDDDQNDISTFTEEKDDLAKMYNNQRPSKDIVIMTKYEKAQNSSTDLAEEASEPRTPLILSSYRKNMLNFFNRNKYKIIIFLIIIMQICILMIVGFCYGLGCKCSKNMKKTEREFFNSKHDVSVTTPLIYTSKSDTETTIFNYDNENCDENKMKQYHSLQCMETRQGKEVQVSDDFINKCKNRRDWRTLIIQSKSDTAKHVDNINTNFYNNYDFKEQDDVTYNVSIKNAFSDDEEQEIKCHSYSSEDRSEPSIQPNSEVKLPQVTDKEAQAYFSNDTLDDYILEKGIHINKENIISGNYSGESKHSRIISEASSKTKGIALRNLSPFLKTKFKSRSTSDSEVNKKNDSIDVELIQVFNRSDYTSSKNTNSDCMRTITIKRNSESRTSY